MSLSKEQSIDESEFNNRIAEIRDNLQEVDNLREENGETQDNQEKSFFDKIIQWWKTMKAFFKKLSKKVADLFSKNSSFFVGLQEGFNGLTMATLLANLTWLIRIGGSAKATILTIYDRTLNSIENPTWWIRYDGPHPNVPNPHININPKISGLPDPHIPISEFSVAFVEFMGPILKFLNDIAPYLLAVKIALDAGRIGYNVYLDCKNQSTRNTIKAVLNIFMSSIGGVGGFHLGCFLGTMVLPGIGTLIGALLIGILGGVGLGMGGDYACDYVLDQLRWDIYKLTCKSCDRVFEHRQYEHGHQTMCPECRDRRIVPFNH